MAASPLPGRVLCALSDLTATGAKGVAIGSATDPRQIVVVRCGEGVRAYGNRCPHMYSTLETFPDRFLDVIGDHLICSTHGALFRVTDGACIKGPCVGFELEPVAVRVEGSDVLLDE